MSRIDWITSLKIGDEIMFQGREAWDHVWRIEKIERETSARFYTKTVTFNKKDGSLHGSYGYVEPPSQAARDEKERRFKQQHCENMLRTIGNKTRVVSSNQLNRIHDQLVKIVEQLFEGKEDNETDVL